MWKKNQESPQGLTFLCRINFKEKINVQTKM